MIHGKITQSISFVMKIHNERNEEDGTKEENFWSIG